MVAAAAARQPAEKSSPSPPPPSEPALDKPDLSKPGALTESLRAMGLM